jgi:hypothetical protein
MSATELSSYLSPTVNGFESKGEVSVALQESLRQQEAGGPVDALPSGLFEVDPNVIEVGPRGVLRGEGAMRTVLRVPANSSGRVVSTKDFAEWELDGTGLWSHTGVPTCVEVRHVGVHGGGANNDNPHLWDSALTYRLNGFDIHSPGAVLDSLQAFACEGVGIRYNRGSAPRYGLWAYPDKEVAEIYRAHVVKCLTGVHIAGSADGILKDCTIAACRDACLKIEGGAWNISNVHVYGCITDDANEDHGVGIINGKPDGLSGPNYFGSQIQVDNCRVGFRNYVDGTTMSQFIGKLCREITLDIQRPLSCGDFVIESMTTANVVGIKIHQAAQFTRLDDGLMGMSVASGTGIICLANGCVINMRGYWGSNLANTALVYGASGVSPNGGVIDVYVNGCGTGLRVDGIGKGNRITIRHGNLVTTPVQLGSGITAAMLNSNQNVVRAYNIETGVQTFPV